MQTHLGMNENNDDEDIFNAEEELDENLDAQPADHDLPVPPVVESGLSQAPDELAQNWLANATEQGNFESSSTEVEEENGIHVRRLVPKE